MKVHRRKLNKIRRDREENDCDYLKIDSEMM